MKSGQHPCAISSFGSSESCASILERTRHRKMFPDSVMAPCARACALLCRIGHKRLDVVVTRHFGQGVGYCPEESWLRGSRKMMEALC